jgi:hypothetical protein
LGRRGAQSPALQAIALSGWLSLSLVAGGCAAQSPAAAPASTPTPSSSGSVVSSSRLILHGQLRCTAQLPGALEPGHKTGLTLTVVNVSHGTVHAVLDDEMAFALVLRAGVVTYDSRVPLYGGSGPPPTSTSIAAGATKTVHPADVWVRWSGPVSIQPVCAGVVLPTLHSTVAEEGPLPDQARALADVVAAAGHVFDNCRPVTSGVAVTGEIDPPSGKAPPMPAACSIELHREGQFWAARTLVVVPPDLRGVNVQQPYEKVSIGAEHGTAEAIAWEFVDTVNGALPVATNTVDTTKASPAMAPDWSWTGSRWEGPGGTHCGGELSTGGASPNATIEFVSVCPA